LIEKEQNSSREIFLSCQMP